MTDGVEVGNRNSEEGNGNGELGGGTVEVGMAKSEKLRIGREQSAKCIGHRAGGKGGKGLGPAR
jgi:hypothetical protein